MKDEGGGKPPSTDHLSLFVVLERELEYLREIIRSSHRPRIRRNRAGAVVLTRELGNLVGTDADVAKPGGQPQRFHEIPHHVAGPRAGAAELFGHRPLTFAVDGLVPLQRSGKQVFVDKLTPYPGTAERAVESSARLFPDARVIVLTRDGRDVAVGGVMHWLNRTIVGQARSRVGEGADALQASRLKSEFVANMSHDTTLTFVNDSCCRYFASSVDAIVGTRLLDRVVSQGREQLVGQVGALTPDAPVATIECQVIAGTGEQRWTQWTMSAAFVSGHMATLQMTGRDIHERVAAEEAKRKLEQQLSRRISISFRVSS